MSLRRGTCPSLSQPMQTGDGLLARINPLGGRVSARQLAGLARAAERFGNGILEVTARGSMQVRGLRVESAAGLGTEVEALEIPARSGLPVDINPLAGLDADEIVDPRPLAREIWQRSDALGLSKQLGPKVSVTVDGGGTLRLGGLIADVKLEAQTSASWLLRVGGASATARALGHFPPLDAAEATLRILQAVAECGPAARVRDLSDAELATSSGRKPRTSLAPVAAERPPVGRFALAGGDQARGFALAYGQIAGKALAAFAEALGEEREIQLAPGRGLIVLNVAQEDDAALLAAAAGLGLVTDPADPRLSIAVCAGKPACASAHLTTRSLADRLAVSRPDLLDGSFTLHVSGCQKQCACPSGPMVSLVGVERGGYAISAEGTALSPDLEAELRMLADEQFGHHP